MFASLLQQEMSFFANTLKICSYASKADFYAISGFYSLFYCVKMMWMYKRIFRNSTLLKEGIKDKRTNLLTLYKRYKMALIQNIYMYISFWLMKPFWFLVVLEFERYKMLKSRCLFGALKQKYLHCTWRSSTDESPNCSNDSVLVPVGLWSPFSKEHVVLPK